MRDPNRIDGILRAIEAIWKQNPDLRLGQLILNAGTENRVYMMEDAALIEQLENLYYRRQIYGASD